MNSAVTRHWQSIRRIVNMDWKRVFVTVGSTTFPELVEAVLSPEVIESLCQLGVMELCVQHGKDGELFRQASEGQTRLAIRGFDYSHSIEGEMKEADLIISHAGIFVLVSSDLAGSGSLLEALHLGKSIIAVPNASLMDNHQVELASALSDQGYILHSSLRWTSLRRQVT